MIQESSTLERGSARSVPTARRTPASVRGGTVTMTTVERVVALHRVDLFADVPGRILAALAQRAVEVEVAGTVVIAEGRWRATWPRCARPTPRAPRRAHHHPAGPGSTVGELAALVPEPRSATVTALEPTTLLRIDRPFSRNCSLIDLRRAGSSAR